jgi:hypothetical protein
MVIGCLRRPRLDRIRRLETVNVPLSLAEKVSSHCALIQLVGLSYLFPSAALSMGGNSSDESDDSTHATEWNKKTVKDLKVARRAFQAAAFVSSGYAPNLEFQERLEELEKEESQKKRSKKKTSTTKTRKTTIETVEGVINEETVRIDHAAIRFATTINIRTGGNHYVPIKEDTGTDVNWITRGLVQQLALHILDAPAGMKFRDFNGNDFEAKHRVTLPLVGETNKSQHAECFIAPDGFPFDCVVVGSAFVNEAGPPHELFAEKPEGTAFVMIQTPVTVSSLLGNRFVLKTDAN